MTTNLESASHLQMVVVGVSLMYQRGLGRRRGETRARIRCRAATCPVNWD